MSVDEELLLLVDRLTAVKSQIEQLAAAARGLEAAITARIPEGPVRDSSGKILAVVKPPGLRFNAKRALEELDEHDITQCQDFSAKRLKEYDPDLYETFRDPSGVASVELINDDDD